MILTKRIKMKKIIALAILLVSLTIYSDAADDKFTFTTTAGKTLHVTGGENGLTFDEYKGKIVFLEFFGHRCPPCLQMIGRYVKLKEKYKDKIAIVAIEVQGLDDAQLKSFSKEKGINYTTVSQEKTGEFVSYIQVRTEWQGGIPFLLLLDKDNLLQYKHSGAFPYDVLEKMVTELSK